MGGRDVSSWKRFGVYVNVRIISRNSCDEVVEEGDFVYVGKYHHLSFYMSVYTDKYLSVYIYLYNV